MNSVRIGLLLLYIALFLSLYGVVYRRSIFFKEFVASVACALDHLEYCIVLYLTVTGFFTLLVSFAFIG